jgi:hypothetical protein
MDNHRTFYKSHLETLNIDRKYGSNWIQNLNNVNNNQDVKLYATGQSSISTGRVYIALPANMKLTDQDILKYNIMK